MDGIFCTLRCDAARTFKLVRTPCNRVNLYKIYCLYDKMSRLFHYIPCVCNISVWNDRNMCKRNENSQNLDMYQMLWGWWWTALSTIWYYYCVWDFYYLNVNLYKTKYFIMIIIKYSDILSVDFLPIKKY